jgi:serine/threonine protein phosphatase PrpC
MRRPSGTDELPRVQRSKGVLRAHGVSDKGRVRPINEDCYLVDERLRLCVVADGMGGHNAGEVAARMAVAAVGEYIRDASAASPPSVEDPGSWPFGFERSLSTGGNLLRTAVHFANVQVLESAATIQAYAGMGTTIVAALVRDNRLSVAHIGDSRLYLYAETRLRQLTVDDSWMAAALAEDPRLDPAALQRHPMRNALTNAVGARRAADVHVVEHPLRGGEVFAMTTDGVHGVLDERGITRMLAEDHAPATIARGLVRTALSHGSRDNCTAVVAKYLPRK